MQSVAVFDLGEVREEEVEKVVVELAFVVGACAGDAGVEEDDVDEVEDGIDDLCGMVRFGGISTMLVSFGGGILVVFPEADYESLPEVVHTAL